MTGCICVSLIRVLTGCICVSLIRVLTGRICVSLIRVLTGCICVSLTCALTGCICVSLIRVLTGRIRVQTRVAALMDVANQISKIEEFSGLGPPKWTHMPAKHDSRKSSEVTRKFARYVRLAMGRDGEMTPDKGK